MSHTPPQFHTLVWRETNLRQTSPLVCNNKVRDHPILGPMLLPPAPLAVVSGEGEALVLLVVLSGVALVVSALDVVSVPAMALALVMVSGVALMMVSALDFVSVSS